jgi:hypothetical protein
MNKYTSYVAAKNGINCPVSGTHFFHSKYDPVHDGELFSEQFTGIVQFMIVYGIAGGYHIAALRRRFPQAKIIAIECNTESISFLVSNPTVHTLFQDTNCIFATPETIADELLRNYIPTLHGTITIAELRSWTSFFQEEFHEAQKKVTSALEQIAADYSVQCHFGGIWQRNILMNLALAAKIPYCNAPNFDTKKIAAIIAAGPSLDKTAATLVNNRDTYFIIATDTAFGALLKRNITADAVISIDGQNISHYHFMHTLSPHTLFVFDLCANPAAVRFVQKAGAPVCFVETGHPLSVYASYYANSAHIPVFPHLETGSGTVTIAAADFARISGYTRLEFFGADFSYTDGKAYTNGTYLEARNFEKATRIKTSETNYDALMFRTPLSETGSASTKTTAILKSYSTSLSSFLKRNSFSHLRKNYYSSCINQYQQHISKERFNSLFFLNRYRSLDIRIFDEKLSILLQIPEILTIIPFLTHLKSSEWMNGNYFSDRELLKLAYTKTLRYTERL